MKKQILTDNETKAFLMKALGCSRQAVWQALNFKRDSEQARRIRQLALKRGGKLSGGYVPECRTLHDHVAGTMVNTFGPRVKIVYDRKSGEARLLVDGECKESHAGLGVDEFMQLQCEAEQLAAAL